MDRVLAWWIRLLVWAAGFARFFGRFGIGRCDVWEPGKKFRLLLAGYNGARNTGADARVAAIAKQCLEVFGPDQVQVTVMTMDTENVAGLFDKNVVLRPFSTIFPMELFRACLENHAAILSEGSTLKSTFANALTLFLCEAAGVMGAQKKPCIAYGSEVGAMEPFLERTAVKLCRDTYFITRTKESQEALEKLGLSGHIGTDTAWTYDGAIPREQAEALLRQQGWDGKEPLVGAAVINPFCWPVRASLFRWLRGFCRNGLPGQYDRWYFFQDSRKRREQFEKYLCETAEGLNRYLAEKNAFPVVIGMERLDEEACRRLSEKLVRPHAMFLSGNTDTGTMTGILRRLDFLVTSRYHACVLSMEAAVPVIAVSMDERLDGILGETGLAQDYLLSCKDPALGEKIHEKLFLAEKERESIQADIRAQVCSAKKKLAEMGIFLRQYMDGRLKA